MPKDTHSKKRLKINRYPAKCNCDYCLSGIYGKNESSVG